VIGAGGTVADSSFAFRAMSEAIKATGGNAEQVDGALLALTQVFSKGKVSAEELNQIAERLPGTFTLFAQAAGKTGPELQKALEQGEVGLNDLMKFLALTGERYGKIALDISSSSQDAGARLTVAFQRMRLEVGNALQPLGAELQETFAAFISEITPAVVSSAKALAAALSFFTNNEVIGGLSKFAFQVGAVALAIKGLQAASAGLVALNIAGWFTGAATGIKITGDASAVAAPKVGLLRGALGGLIALAAKPVVITIVLAGVIEAIKRIGDVNKAFAEFLNTSKELTGGSWLSSVGGGALSTKELSGLANEVSNAYNFNAAELKRLEQQKSIITLQQNTDATSGAELAALNNRLIAVNTGIETAKKRMTSAKSKLDAIYGQLNQPKPAAAPTGTDFPSPAGEGKKDKASDKAARDAEAAAAEQQRLNEANAQAQLRLSDSVFKAQVDFDRKRFELQQELINKERDLRIAALTGVAAETASQTAQFFRTIDELRQRATQAAVNATGSQQALQNAVFMRSVTAAPAAASAGGGALTGGARVNRTRDRDAEATGYDIVMPGGRGAPVQAPIDLTITGTGFQGRGAGSTGKGYGNYVTGEFTLGGKKYELLLGHFDTVSVSKGMQVPAGAKLGTQGITGRTFGTHATTHVNPMGGASVSDAWSALESISRAYETGRPAAAGGRRPTGVAAQQRRNAADQGDVAIAQVDFDMAVKYKALLEEMVQKRLPQEVQLFAVEGAKAYNAQSQALRDNVAELEKRQMLELSSTRQEVIDGELQKFQLTRNYNREIAQLNADLAQKEVLEDPTGTKAAGINARIAATTQGYADQRAALDELTAAQIAFNDAQRYGQDNRIGLGIKEGALAYVESVGTMRDATAQLTQTGIKGVEDALFSLVTTGTANFREFAAEILKQSARMILQLTIQRVIMQILGAISGGSTNLGSSAANVAQYAPLPNAMGNAYAANNIVPYAMGGAFTNSVVSKPTLFKFAAGGTMRTGVMGEAGPEAIMPLSRGPNGKLGVASSGGGGTNVTVNVDASGNSQVAGDQNQGAQLGRVIAGAVQQELIRQKRPGGLLA
jgi:lambda family phage tail tape measure protein